MFSDEGYYDNLGEFFKLNQNLNIHFDDPEIKTKTNENRELGISASTELFFSEEFHNKSIRKDIEPIDLKVSSLSKIAPISTFNIF